MPSRDEALRRWRCRTGRSPAPCSRGRAGSRRCPHMPMPPMPTKWMRPMSSGRALMLGPSDAGVGRDRRARSRRVRVRPKARAHAAASGARAGPDRSSRAARAARQGVGRREFGSGT
jgi:hypothetical protein